jgi:hypothetical protein
MKEFTSQYIKHKEDQRIASAVVILKIEFCVSLKVE